MYNHKSHLLGIFIEKRLTSAKIKMMKKAKPSPNPSFNTKIWINQNENFDYPEKAYGVEQNTAVCFSGGGTRSLAATMGQLRGLNSLNLIDKIDYISCVSGGSWASVAYTYYKTHPSGGGGPITDADFLGPVTAPGSIVVNKPHNPSQNWLGSSDPKRLGTTATQSLTFNFFQLIYDWADDYIDFKGWSHWDPVSWYDAFEKIPWSQLWSAAVGLTYFKPFGLFESYNPFQFNSIGDQPYFTLNAASLANIRSRNQGNSLKGAEFFTVRNVAGEQKRPYLIVSSSVVGPTALAPFKAEAPIGFEYTPLYIGSAYSPNGQAVNYGSGTKLLVGSGYIEPFAYGGNGPGSIDSGTQSINVSPTPFPFTLAAASGTSSSAFASAIEENYETILNGLKFKGIVGAIEKFALGILLRFLQKDTGLADLSPQSNYWPVASGNNQPTTPFTFADGGALDNYGLITLLRRRVKNIVVFINTSTKLDPTLDPTKKIKSGQIDTSFPPLFGVPTHYTGIFTQNNQVFPKEEFAIIVNALKLAKKNRKTVMAKYTHTIAENDWWGIQGVKLDASGNPAHPNHPVSPNDQVNILWVYNDRVKDWEKALTTEQFYAKGLGEVTLKEAIESGNASKPEGPFKLFPNYATAFQNHDYELVELTAMQVNLLADLSCWNITENQAVFKQMLG